MSILKELTKNKSIIIERLLQNKNVCKATHYADKDFLSKPDFDTDITLYNNIYPYTFIPPTDDNTKEQKTYITVSLDDIRKAGSSSYKAGYINIAVFTHKNLFRTSYGYLRTDFIVSEIDEMLSDKRGIGMGKLEFVNMTEAVINEYYQGYVLRYRPVDLG